MSRLLVAALGLMLAAPSAAAADGLPVTGVYGADGIAARGGSERYLTFPSGRSTVVARVNVDGGSVSRYRSIPGRFTVPVVAFDGSTSGLSTDGRTLLLIRPRPGLTQERTQMAVVDPVRLLVQKRIELAGDFSFDALSPDGSTAYLIEYLSLTRHNFDPTNYRVRALDTETGKLDSRPIVDPREPDEEMGGLPITRAASPDGRWAYTFYSGGEHPFVHALDTTGRSARCIDLDALTGRDDLFQLRLRVAAGGRVLQVVKRKKPVMLVDTRTFAATAPRPVAQPQPQPQAARPDERGTRVWPWAAAFGLLALLAVATARPLARARRAR
jgi:hypothetical protein